MEISSSEVKRGDDNVDRFDADEGQNEAADAIDKQISSEKRCRPHRPVGDSFQGERDQRNDDQRIEDDGRQNRRLRRRQSHHVQCAEFRISSDEQRRQDRKIFRDIVGDGKCR